VAIFGTANQTPKLQKLGLRLEPLRIFRALKENYQDVFLLESLTGPDRLAEYSFIGFNPALLIDVHNGFTRIYQAGSIIEDEADPLTIFRRILKRFSRIGLTRPRFIGGLVGYVSYDACFLWEDLRVGDKPGAGFPLMRLGFFEDALIYDHRRCVLYYSHLGEDRLSLILGLIKDVDPSSTYGRLSYSEPRSNMDEFSFIEMVEAGKEYIERGDVFQVVLSRRLEFEITGDLLLFYIELRKMNPSPYMYYLRLGDEEIVGSSPEMLIRVEGDRAMTFPIAGTRPRESDPVLDAKSDKELLMDEKERAEHVMLVDLARNDLGKIAEYGSVEVKEFMKLVKYSHVKHLVSRVEARLKQQHDMFDAFKAIFPAGTVSGAPKPRAMEIIDELEPVRRGPYAGAVGYFSLNGCCDFAITIRTLVRKGSWAAIQAGAGIVWDSIPEREWLETQHKMMALLKALEGVGG